MFQALKRRHQKVQGESRETEVHFMFGDLRLGMSRVFLTQRPQRRNAKYYRVLCTVLSSVNSCRSIRAAGFIMWLLSLFSIMKKSTWNHVMSYHIVPFATERKISNEICRLELKDMTWNEIFWFRMATYDIKWNAIPLAQIRFNREVASTEHFLDFCHHDISVPCLCCFAAMPLLYFYVNVIAATLSMNSLTPINQIVHLTWNSYLHYSGQYHINHRWNVQHLNGMLWHPMWDANCWFELTAVAVGGIYRVYSWIR